MLFTTTVKSHSHYNIPPLKNYVTLNPPNSSRSYTCTAAWHCTSSYNRARQHHQYCDTSAI